MNVWEHCQSIYSKDVVLDSYCTINTSKEGVLNEEEHK